MERRIKSFCEIKESAKRGMEQWIKNCIDVSVIKIIFDEEFLEGEGFWIFFLHKDIKIPDTAWAIRQFPACAITKYGDIKYVRDIRKDVVEKEKAIKGLSKWVLNCKEH